MIFFASPKSVHSYLPSYPPNFKIFPKEQTKPNITMKFPQTKKSK